MTPNSRPNSSTRAAGQMTRMSRLRPQVRAAALASLALTTVIGLVSPQSADARPTPAPSPISTTTTLERSTAGATYGTPVGFSAKVSGGRPDGGIVTFSANGQPIAGCEAQPVVYEERLVAGRAVCSTSALPAGSHSVVARFSGYTGYSASQSAPVGVLITKAPTVVDVSCSPNPVVYPQDSRCTARVSSSTIPTGKVTWKTSGNGYFPSTACELSAGDPNGSSCSVSYRPAASDVNVAGGVTITGTFVGTANFEASFDTALLAVRPT